MGSSITLTGSSGLFESAMGSTFPKRGDYEYIKKKTQDTFFAASYFVKKSFRTQFSVNFFALRNFYIRETRQKLVKRSQLYK